jgi:predicted nucleic acid-binding protein
LTVGELRKGVSNRKRKDIVGGLALEAWVDKVEIRFAARILGVDLRIATLWGALSADRTRTAVDTLLAATAIVHGLTLVTRNTKDVADLPVRLLNPWES